MLNSTTFSALWISAGVAGIFTVLRGGLGTPLRWTMLALAAFLVLTAAIPLIPRLLRRFPARLTPLIQWTTCLMWVGLGGSMVAYYLAARQMAGPEQSGSSGVFFAIFGAVIMILSPVSTLYVRRRRQVPPSR